MNTPAYRRFMIDPMAPSAPGRWQHNGVEIVRNTAGNTCERSGPIHATRSRHGLRVTHSLRPSDLSDRLAIRITDELGRALQSDFETVMVGLIRSTIDDPVESWTEFYRNSMQELISGASAFAPVHERAAHLVAGDSVVDLGSCFGFFALRLARNGIAVTATDICGSTMRLLRKIAPELSCSLDTLACNANAVPLPDGSADTVTAIHLLEHVDADTGASIVAEAIRVARRRVIVAVPFESTPQTCHGHVRTFDAHALHVLGEKSGHHFTVTVHHGGWLTIDL